MEAVSISRTPVSIFQAARRNIAEESHLHSRPPWGAGILIFILLFLSLVRLICNEFQLRRTSVIFTTMSTREKQDEAGRRPSSYYNNREKI
jgi:hypothetical protein